MSKTPENYHWRIYEKILLCLVSGIFIGLTMWLGMLLLWNAFSYPDQTIAPFFPRLIFGFALLSSLILPYLYPKLYILPVWVLSVVMVYFQSSFIIGSIMERHDISSPFYAPDVTAWYDQSYLFSVLILTTLILSTCGLLRPALFYVRNIWGKLKNSMTGR